MSHFEDGSSGQDIHMLPQSHSAEAVSLEGFGLTSFDLMLAIEQRYAQIVSRYLEERRSEILASQLFGQMIKNSYVKSFEGLTGILVDEFGKQLTMLLLKETEILSKKDIAFAGHERVFKDGAKLNKNAISNFVYNNQSGNSSEVAVQRKVEKTVSALLLIGFLEVDTEIGKGRTKVLVGTSVLKNFIREWAVESAKVLRNSSTESRIG